MNWHALQRTREPFIAESVFDALSFWSAGVRDTTCVFGVQGLPRDLEEMLGRYATRRVHFCLDGDAAGRDAVNRHAIYLQQRGIQVWTTTLPEGRDPNALLLEHGADAMRDLALRQRPVAGEVAPPPDTAPECTCTLNDEGLTLTTDGCTWQATRARPSAVANCVPRCVWRVRTVRSWTRWTCTRIGRAPRW